MKSNSLRKTSMLSAILRVFFCMLGALFVTTPVGFVVQRYVSFNIVRVAGDSAIFEALTFAAILLALGLAATILVAVPVEFLVRRLRSSTILVQTLASALIASTLFWWKVPFPFAASDASWLIALQATYFAIYFSLRAALRERTLASASNQPVASR